MGNLQSNNETHRYDALKKLYAMNQQQMNSLKLQLSNERQKNHILTNNTVRNEASNNSMMQRDFVNSLKKEQSKLRNKINHEIMKLFIVNKVAFQTASLKRKEQIVVETQNKIDSVLLFLTIFSSFFVFMMAVRAIIIV